MGCKPWLPKTAKTSVVVNGNASAPFVAADSPAQMEAVLRHYEEIVSSGGWPTVPSAPHSDTNVSSGSGSPKLT